MSEREMVSIIPAPLAVAPFHEGVPPSELASLKIRLRRSARRSQRNAFLLVAPLLAFIFVTFLLPISLLLIRSVDNHEVGDLLPRTTLALSAWDGEHSPPDEAFRALVTDLAQAPRDRVADIGRRLNYYSAGLRSIVTKAGREAPQVAPGDARSRLVASSPLWDAPATWSVIKRATQRYTDHYLLAAVDLRRTDRGDIRHVETDAIYLEVIGRTLGISLAVAALCLILGYPVAYFLATTSPAASRWLMMLVLLPFWTSLLVRTTAWLVLLQSNGVVNSVLLHLGIVAEPMELVHNRTGVLIAMTHILLPFVVLPTLAVMKGVSPVYMRAASSLGAPFWRAFLKVYLPMTMPGAAAGGLLVFILALGYYITPTLVGGPRDQMLSTFIAYFVNQSNNWGMAAALSTVLLTIVVALYIVLAVAYGSKQGKLR